MCDSMVERVARAICAGMGWSWEDSCRTTSDTQERCRTSSRAAIAAMPEPPAAMKHATSAHALNIALSELKKAQEERDAARAELAAARRDALEEAAKIVRVRACGYLSLPQYAIFNAGFLVEDLSLLEQRIRALISNAGMTSEVG